MGLRETQGRGRGKGQRQPKREEKDSRWLEILLILVVFEVDERWEQENHVSTFVHDWCTTVCAADFAGEFVNAGLLAGFVPAEIVVAVSEVDVVFVEDGAPLEGCS